MNALVLRLQNVVLSFALRWIEIDQMNVQCWSQFKLTLILVLWLDWTEQPIEVLLVQP